MIINGSGNVIEQRGKFLLVQEGRKEFSGKWNLPCGELDSGESIVCCAAREGKEETGFELEILAHIMQYQQLEWHVLGGHDIIVNIFHSKIVGGEKTVPSDLLDVAWFSFEKIYEMAARKELLHPYVLDAIAKYAKRKYPDENNRQYKEKIGRLKIYSRRP